MRVVFDETGDLREFHEVTPVESAPQIPGWTVIDVEYPAYLVRGIARAVALHRFSYINGHVCLDGVAWSPPAARAETTYGQALAAIAAATTVAQMRAILRRVCDQLLDVGALEL